MILKQVKVKNDCEAYRKIESQKKVIVVMLIISPMKANLENILDNIWRKIFRINSLLPYIK